MKNITHAIHILGAAFVAVILFGANSCYAEKTSEEVTVKCGSGPGRLSGVREWPGKLGMQYILKTEGIRVLGEPELVTDWTYYLAQGTAEKISSNNGCVSVRAECRSPGSSVARLKVNMWPSDGDGEEKITQSTDITCNEGESLRVIMSGPKDPNPNMYNYVGMLTKITR